MTADSHNDVTMTAAAIAQAASIEHRIAASLLADGRFQQDISATDFEAILSNVIYTLISDQKVAGLDVDIAHSIESIDVTIRDGKAHVLCTVHIASPIAAYIEFMYTLENDPDTPQAIRLKAGSLRVKEKTRRFDLKAKAALAAMNVKKITLHEMADMPAIIQHTLPPQLEAQGISGTFSRVGLWFNNHQLHVILEGDFAAM